MNKRSLEEVSEEINVFPLDSLPIDLIVKIFLESQFTVKELHTLCNLNTKIKKVCNDRKIWEQIFFRKVLEKDKEMKIAEKNGTLPELMKTLRETEEFKNYNLLTDYEPFVRCIAFKLTNFDRRFRVFYYINIYMIFLDLRENNCIRLISDFFYSNETTTKKIFEIWNNAKIVENGDIIITENYNSLKMLKFICYLISNSWKRMTYAFDNIPLECSICSTSKDLKKCECCEQIYCSVNCQIKNH